MLGFVFVLLVLWVVVIVDVLRCWFTYCDWLFILYLRCLV